MPAHFLLTMLCTPRTPLESHMMLMGAGPSNGGLGYTPPLDGLASKVLTAWATFRLFTGNSESLRVRESGGSTEADIGTLASGGFDTTAFAAHVGAGSGYAAKSYDQNSTNDFVQATAGSQPQVITTGLNAKTALLFSGAQKITTGSLDWTTTWTDGFEFWSLVKPSAASLTGGDKGIAARSSYAPEFYVRSAAANKPGLYSGGNRAFNTTLVADTVYLLRFYYHGGTWRCDVNGVTEANTYTIAAPPTTAAAFTMGNDGAVGDYFTGHMACALLFKQALTSGESGALTTSLKTIGGIA